MCTRNVVLAKRQRCNAHSIMREFFHRTRKDNPSAQLPKIFGMTASPILARVSTHTASVDKLKELQFNLDCSILTVRNRDEISSFVARAAESIVEYCPAAKDEALAIGRLDVGDEFPTTAALATYHFYVSAIIHMRNEASNQDTMLKLDKMLAAVQEMKDDLGLWGRQESVV